jgi:DNA-binding NarL/FixJ family response regulator
MPGHFPELDREALRRLREAARLVHKRRSYTIPIREILALAEVAPAGQGITIDFEASRDLGDAFIVVRVPAGPNAEPVHTRFECLSQRERQVAELVAAGLSNKRIADRLCIATSTVKDHVHHILEKTGLGNRAAVAARWRVRPVDS